MKDCERKKDKQMANTANARKLQSSSSLEDAENRYSKEQQWTCPSEEQQDIVKGSSKGDTSKIHKKKLQKQPKKGGLRKKGGKSTPRKSGFLCCL